MVKVYQNLMKGNLKYLNKLKKVMKFVMQYNVFKLILSYNS